MRAFVFDVDNTLTPPRRPLEPEMAAALIELPVAFHVAAGSDVALVREQLVDPLWAAGFRGTFDAFVCNGSDRYRFEIDDDIRPQVLRTFSLRKHLGKVGFQTLMDTLTRRLADPAFAIDAQAVAVIGGRIIDRGSMINLAPIGRPIKMTPAAYTNRDAFVAFDQRTGFRRRLLEQLHQDLAPLIRDRGLWITLGGQTSFDIVIAGNDKTFPLRTLADEGYDDLTYFGDALHEHGNDAAVLEFVREQEHQKMVRVRAVQVTDWRDTLQHLQRYL